MRVFRIGRTEYINDLSGEGARLFGGRWNREGTAVLYTASTKSLAAWEFFVNIDDKIKLSDNAYSCAEIEIPDHSIKEIESSSLPHTWPIVGGSELFDITEEWIRESKYFCMRVPSAVVEGEYNYLVSPNHIFFKSSIRIVNVGYFKFDERAFGKEIADSSTKLTKFAKKIMGEVFVNKIISLVNIIISKASDII